jgi:hypothetical protein
MHEPLLYKNLAGAGATTVKDKPGYLKLVQINKAAANGVVDIYDNTAASGTKIATITFGAAILSDPPYPAFFGAQFTTGLHIVITGALDVTVIFG